MYAIRSYYAFLDKTGAGKFFIDLSYSITGRFSGGPAKTAVVASGFMGSVAGSAVANVVATGSVITSYSIHYTKLYDKMHEQNH